MQRFENKYDLLKAAYKDEDLKKSTIALFQYLVHKSDKNKCFPAIDTIAKAMNVCRRTVQYNMRKLEAAGYIIRKDRWYNHQQLSNSYEFNFGVIEKNPDGSMTKYTDAEKESLNEFLFHNLGDNMAPGIEKSKETLKIYNMKLSKYEKLLMIYLIHRADKYAFIYDDLETYSKAIGVCRTTLVRLLAILRRKGLILVQNKRMGHRNLVTIRLTRKIYQDNNSVEAVESISVVHSVQNITTDQQPTIVKNLHTRKYTRINKILKKLTGKIIPCKMKEHIYHLFSKIFCTLSKL